MPRKPSAKPAKKPAKVAEGYTHPDQTVLMRPEVGTQAQFRKKKPPVTYRYDSSLSPALEWDDQVGGRELGEWLIDVIRQAAALPAPHVLDSAAEFKDAGGAVIASVRSLDEAVEHLKRLTRPFLNWAGKAERLSFDVPTLPLFVHERLSTKAIVETLVSHKADKQVDMFDLFGDPHHSVTDQVLRAYEHADKWVNRLILGDSLVVMNSLLHYERLGGQVQMIYIDPPYGVKFGSNFQPFVRKRDVSHGDDEDLTREPEMVKAYRDTWELGLHSYLTYKRDRLLMARELLTASGSVFVQISDENLHHVRELMDEVFGAENFCGVLVVAKAGAQSSQLTDSVADYLLWYARDRERVKYRDIFTERDPFENPSERYVCVETPSGEIIDLSRAQKERLTPIPEGRICRLWATYSQSRSEASDFDYEFQGQKYRPPQPYGWQTTKAGLKSLEAAGRLHAIGKSLRWKVYHDEFPYKSINNVWADLRAGGFGETRLYVVQTDARVIARCLLMTTDPGDLVFDPTCGSGTSAYVAEQWGRRWITVDTSRVPLALARQRLLTATFPYYELKEAVHGPSGGFVYKRKQNKKGEETGGIVPHTTLGSIANNEPPKQEVLVDRPEIDNSFVRVTGPFVVEATIPAPVDWEGDGIEDSGAESIESYGSFIERMIEVLRRSPVLHLGGGRKVEVVNVRPPAKSLSLSAEGLVGATAEGQAPTVADAFDEAVEKNRRALPFSGKPVAFVFGPENGAVSEKLVHEALKEAGLKHYTHLYVIGFAIQPHARQLVDRSADMGLPPATYVQATPDLMMGDLLKNMRSSQIFSVCGLPEIRLHKKDIQKKDVKGVKDVKTPAVPLQYEVELVGLDTFDPTTMKTDHRRGDDVPCWMLDADYNNLCFRATQVFFPRTGAWESLKKALKADYDETVWDHLAGSRSAPFEAGEHKQIAVKVIDDRGNELLVVKELA
jgi:adenine-specific DNA-methyltransferase